MVGECKFTIKKKETDWLSTLLSSEFFGSCLQHKELRKNEKNGFCIDCNHGFCRHCLKAHCLHRQLQICKYVYQDVVRLQDIQKHLDCSKIQTYKINGDKAVHLNSRPQSKDMRPSTKAKFGASCEACGRYLQDVPNRFCSIACKDSIVPLKPHDQSHKKISFSIHGFPELSWKENDTQERNFNENESLLPAAADTSEETQGLKTSEETPGSKISTLKPRKQLRKRKGIPHRSPLS